jgi:hypothetical protein
MFKIPVEAYSRNGAPPGRCERGLWKEARVWGNDSADRALFVWEKLQEALSRSPSREETAAFADYVGYDVDVAFWDEIAAVSSVPYAAITPFEPFQVVKADEMQKLLRLLRWRSFAEPRERTCGYGELHESRGRSGVHRCVHLLCHKWDCAVCAKWLKKRWAEHAAAKIRSVESVYFLGCSRAMWKAQVSSAERRKRGDGGYIRINLPGVANTPEVALFTTAPIGDPMPTEDAVVLAEQLILACPAEKRAVSTSTTWTLPNRESKNEWRRVGRVATTMDQARAIVSEFALHPSSPFVVGSADDHAHAFEFRLGPEVTPDTVEYQALVESLATGTLPSVALGTRSNDLVAQNV